MADKFKKIQILMILMIFSPNLTKLIQQLLLPRILHEAPAARLRAHPVPGRKRSPEGMEPARLLAQPRGRMPESAAKRNGKNRSAKRKRF